MNRVRLGRNHDAAFDVIRGRQELRDDKEREEDYAEHDQDFFQGFHI